MSGQYDMSTVPDLMHHWLNVGELAFVCRYFENPLRQRLAFREFGTCLGIKCAAILASSPEENQDLIGLADDILDEWEEAGIEGGGDGKLDAVIKRQGLRPITKVMYATALIPGGELPSSVFIYHN